MSKWKNGILSDIAEIIMGQSPAGENCSNNFIGLPLLNGPTEFTNHSPIPVQFTNDTKRESRKGDILFCVRGSTTGKMNWSDQSYAIGRGIAAIRHKSGVHLNRYIRGIIDHSLDELLQGATGSTFPNVSRTDIGNIQIEIPPLPEQERIAEVLSSLDDKIDLLHRNNKTLELLAETLFRQWFVEEAEDSWETGILSDLVTVKYGKDHKKLTDGNIPAYGSGGVMRMVNKALYDKESVLIPRKGTLSNIIYINKPFWTVDTMFFTEMKKENIAKYIYQFIKEQDLASMNVGSAVPSMTTDILNNLPITIPPKSVLEIFENQVSLFYKKVDSNLNNIQQLETLRDTLLPKLMNGLVRVEN